MSLDEDRFIFISDGAEQTCSYDIPHGRIMWWCKILSDNICRYSCDEGYEKHPAVFGLICVQSSGTWASFGFSTVTDDNFCTRKHIFVCLLNLLYVHYISIP